MGSWFFCSKKNRIIPHFLQTIPLEKLHKERKNNESNIESFAGWTIWAESSSRKKSAAPCASARVTPC